jgi:ketosteroid isomerase-like protein
MSQENLEVARRGYEHVIATQEVLDEDYHPDYVLDMSGFRGWPERQTYRGVDGLRAFIADWLEPWDEFEFEVEELRDAGDKVVAVARQQGLSKATGVPVDMRLAHVITYHDGKAIRTQMYASPQEGLEAAGLSE